VRWHKQDGSKETWYLKNSSLDTLHDDYLKQLLNEKSILLKDPDSSTLPITLPHLQH
jgi:hypothetical protein